MKKRWSLSQNNKNIAVKGCKAAAKNPLLQEINIIVKSDSKCNHLNTIKAMFSEMRTEIKKYYPLSETIYADTEYTTWHKEKWGEI